MDYVLNALVASGEISKDAARAVDPLNPDGSPDLVNQAALQADLAHGQAPQVGPAAHFVQYVEDELPQLLQDEPGAFQGSLAVTTTLDLTYQENADNAVEEGLPRMGGGANNAALLMMDPSNGQVLAWVGSADYDDPAIDGEDDFVTLDGLQPGSSFKPYVYETGFQDGTITPTRSSRTPPRSPGPSAGSRTGTGSTRATSPLPPRCSTLATSRPSRPPG
jgi:membrane peptidoglycan carboxypeptidase